MIAGATATLFADAALTSLAANPATADDHWPGPLDLLRQAPWVSVGVLFLLGLTVTLLLLRLDADPRAVAGDPPPPGPPVLDDWLVDREEVRHLVSWLCARDPGAVGITTGLRGAGGFGKTRIAQMACADRRVRRHYRNRIYLVTVGRDVRSRAAISAKIGEITCFITGDTTTYTDPVLAGGHLARKLGERPRTLLVLDDVWHEDQLAPFLPAADHCTLLVTTRVPGLLPPSARQLTIDQMTPDQARRVLASELDTLPEPLVESLLDATGGWPLLLRTTNRLIAAEIATGREPVTAATAVLGRLRAGGPAAVDAPSTAIDVGVPAQRERAVRATIEAATLLLPPGGAERYAELGVFAEDEVVPVELVDRLWERTGSLTSDDTGILCRTLAGLSLLTLTRVTGGPVTVDEVYRDGRIALHDVYRDYLRAELGPSLIEATNRALVDGAAAALPTAEVLTPARPAPRTAWWEAPEGYLRDHVVEHLLAAGDAAQAEALAGDLRWVESRLDQRGPAAPISDLSRIPTASAAAAAQDLARAAHLFAPTHPPYALTSVLHSRLQELPAWHDQVAARLPLLGGPALHNAWPPPDLPSTALERTLVGHTDAVTAVAISPDGGWLASAGWDGTVRIWDRATGSSLATLIGHTEWVNAVVIAPDGSWLASAADDATVRIWGPAGGAATAVLVSGTRGVHSLAVAPDGSWLAAVDDDHRVWLWDLLSGAAPTVLDSPLGRSNLSADSGNAVAVSPDGHRLAAVDWDRRTVRIWDRATGELAASLDEQADAVRAVRISPDGRRIATVGQEAVTLWDRDTNRPVATVALGPRWANALEISPDGSWIATAESDDTVRLRDLATNATIDVFSGHGNRVSALAIAPDGSWLASASWDQRVRIWNRTGEGAGGRPAAAGAVSIAAAPDGSWLATAGIDSRVRILDLTGQVTSTWTDRDDRACAVAVSPDGSWIAALDFWSVQLREPTSGAAPRTLSSPDAEDLRTLAVSPDGSWIAAAGKDRGIHLWDCESGDLRAVLTGHPDFVFAVRISPDGSWLAAADGNGQVRIWDVASGRITAVLTQHTDQVRALAIAPDGSWLVSGGHDGRIVLWDRASGSARATLLDHGSEVLAVAVSPDGAWIASTGEDHALRIWRAADGDEVACMRTDGSLYDCVWTPDGSSVAAVGGLGTYRYAFRPGSGA